MEMLHKGTLTVVIATVVASGMILLTGNSVADVKDNTSNQAPKKLSNSAEGKINGVATKVLRKQKARVEDALLAPPPGPYMGRGDAKFNMNLPIAPISPQAPTKSSEVVKKPVAPANASSAAPAPIKPKKVVTTNENQLKKPLMPQTPKMSPNKKAMKQAAPNPPSTKMGVAPVMPERPKNIPIWMQEAAVKGNSQNLQHQNNANQNLRQTPSLMWNNFHQQNKQNLPPPQQYMYVPVPMLPQNFVVPQMRTFTNSPILNSGPQPPQFMAPQQKQTLPNPSKIEMPKAKDVIK